MNKTPVLNDSSPPNYVGGVVVETHPVKYRNTSATGGVLISSHPVVWAHNASANGSNGNNQNGDNG
jgi:hypothetical protein